VDAAVTGAIGPSDGPRAACGPGCASCCQLNVGTLAVEGAVVAAFLRAAIRRRGLDARRRDVSGMTAPFLADPDLLSAWLAGAELPIG
jgi:hypothetical protein